MPQPDDDLEVRRRRAIYRAWHRGTKEMDLLLGRYVSQHVALMDEAELSVFEELLELPDPTMTHWILHAPEEAPGGDIAAAIRRLRQFHGLA